MSSINGAPRWDRHWLSISHWWFCSDMEKPQELIWQQVKQLMAKFGIWSSWVLTKNKCDPWQIASSVRTHITFIIASYLCNNNLISRSRLLKGKDRIKGKEDWNLTTSMLSRLPRPLRLQKCLCLVRLPVSTRSSPYRMPLHQLLLCIVQPHCLLSWHTSSLSVQLPACLLTWSLYLHGMPSSSGRRGAKEEVERPDVRWQAALFGAEHHL